MCLNQTGEMGLKSSLIGCKAKVCLVCSVSQIFHGSRIDLPTPLSIRRSSYSRYSNKSIVAPTSYELPQNDYPLEFMFKSFCNAFNRVLILSGYSLFHIF